MDGSFRWLLVMDQIAGLFSRKNDGKCDVSEGGDAAGRFTATFACVVRKSNRRQVWSVSSCPVPLSLSSFRH